MSKKTEIKQVVIDADFLIFRVTEGKNTKMTMFQKRGKSISKKKYEEPLEPYIRDFHSRVESMMDQIAVQTICEDWKLAKDPLIVFSDPNGNFRYELEPNYKGNRKGSERSELYYRLRKWATKKFFYGKNLEADDVVSYYVRDKNYLGVTFDKDMLHGVAGIWYNPHEKHLCMVKTTHEEAERFCLMQTLAGDPVDNIKGLPRVGLPTAKKLLDEHGWDWNGVVSAYESKGLTKKDAVLARRLIGMDQVKVSKKGKFKVKLFTAKKRIKKNDKN
jgi:DNA polymerase-1